LIEQTLDVEVTMLGLGISVPFRNKGDAECFEANRLQSLQLYRSTPLYVTRQ
jgi:hypothetical protein